MADTHPSRLWAADFLRVAAIGLVAWYHIWQQSWLNPGFWVGHCYINLQQVVRNGYLMVDILLVLSGFLLALLHCENNSSVSPLPFYRRRFFRIYPSYFLILVLSLLFQILPQGLYSSAGECIGDVFAHLTFTHNLFFRSYFSTPFTGVLWTLAVEVQFYLLFPLIACFFRRRPMRSCVVLCLIAWAYRAYIYFYSPTAMYVNQLPAMLDAFAAGMAAAWIYTRLRTRKFHSAHFILFAILTAVSFALLLQLLYWQTLGDQTTVHRGQLLIRFPLAVIAAAFLLFGSLLPAKTSRILGNRVTVFLSGITYNFYLWHQFIALWLKQIHIPAYTNELPNQAGEQPWQIQYTLLCFAVTLIWSILLTYLIEKPFTRFGRKTTPPS